MDSKKKVTSQPPSKGPRVDTGALSGSPRRFFKGFEEVDTPTVIENE